MTVAEQVLRHLQSLPESVQAQVLDYVEYLEAKTGRRANGQEDADWRELSLIQALRGMEAEPSPYSTEDLKEVFP